MKKPFIFCLACLIAITVALFSFTAKKEAPKPLTPSVYYYSLCEKLIEPDQWISLDPSDMIVQSNWTTMMNDVPTYSAFGVYLISIEFLEDGVRNGGSDGYLDLYEAIHAVSDYYVANNHTLPISGHTITVGTATITINRSDGGCTF